MSRRALKRQFTNFYLSWVAHAALALALLVFGSNESRYSPAAGNFMRVELVQPSTGSDSHAQSSQVSQALSRRHPGLGGSNSNGKFLFVPSWSKALVQGSGSGSTEDRSEGSRQLTRDMLETESKVSDIFDALARRIHGHLDYPDLLWENGIQGTAAIDLYFDSSGDLDESKSNVSGDRRVLRGLLVRATRKGLVSWLKNDAQRLRREQYRNQHSRADFIIAYSQVDQAPLMKLMPGSYVFTRERVSNVSCIGNFGGAPVLNVACIAASVGSAIHRGLSDHYKMRLAAVQDALEYQDSLGLHGINDLARSKS